MFRMSVLSGAMIALLAGPQPVALAEPPPTRRATVILGPRLKPVKGDALRIATAYRQALADQAVRNASRDEILRQIRGNVPIALLNGYWVTPIDMRLVYAGGIVRDSITARIRGTSAFAVFEALLANNAGDAGQFAVALTPNRAITELGLVNIQQRLDRLKVALGEEVIQRAMHDIEHHVDPSGMTTDLTGIEEVIIAIGLAAAAALLVEAAKAVYDHVTSGSEPLDSNTGLPIDDPGADPDGDGTPNRLDSDDDGDGVSDDDDNYPYDPKASICDCKSPFTIIGLENSLSAEITNLASNAYDLAWGIGRSHTVVTIASAGSIAGGTSAVNRSPRIQVTFPGEIN